VRSTCFGGSGTALAPLKFYAVKTLKAAAFFGYLFFAVDHIYWINMEQLQLA